MEKFPLIDMTIDDHEETGVEFIAFVDTPAIEREWMAFNSQPRMEFKVSNEEKRIVSGPVMVANLPIYRRDEAMGEYYVKFSPASIEKIVQRFFKNRMTTNVNLMHETPVEGVYLAGDASAPLGWWGCPAAVTSGRLVAEDITQRYKPS